MNKRGRMSVYIHKFGRINIPLSWDERHPGRRDKYNDENEYGVGYTKLPQRQDKVHLEETEESEHLENLFDGYSECFDEYSAELMAEWKALNVLPEEIVDDLDERDFDIFEDERKFLNEFFPVVDDRLFHLLSEDEAYLAVLDLEMDDCWSAAEVIGREDRDEDPIDLLAHANAATLRKFFEYSV